LTLTDNFAKAIAFALWPILAMMKKLRFFEYYLFLKAVFCIEQLKNVCRVFFSNFFGILNFDPKWNFAKAIAFALWPILAMMEKLRFFEYYLFLRAAFCTEKLKNVSQVFFSMFLSILNFGPKWQFCKGYNLCIVANFGHDEKIPIFRILGVFESRFLQRTA